MGIFSFFEKKVEKSDVYCDNENLKRAILDAKPSTNGLYPHELVMIEVARWGYINTREFKFPCVFNYIGVKIPSLLLESLVNREYIKLCEKEDLIKFLKINDLRSILKSRNIKISSKKDLVIKQVEENFSREEIYEYFKFLYYIPTEKGLKELLENQYVIDGQYSVWEKNSGYAKFKYIKNYQIEIIDSLKKEIKVTTNPFNIYFRYNSGGKSDSIGWVTDCAENSNISLKIDDKIIVENFNVDTIYVMKNICKLVFCKKVEEDRIECFGYDLMSGERIFREEIKQYFCSMAPEYQYEYALRTKSNNRIFTGEDINYFISIKSVIAYYVFYEYFKEEIKIKKIDNYIKEDYSLNYCITVNKNNDYVRNIIMYMGRIGIIDRPVIMGVPVNKIMEYLRYNKEKERSNSKTKLLMIDNELFSIKEKLSLLEEICKNIPTDLDCLLNLIEKSYPLKILHYDFFGYYASEGNYKRDENYIEVSNNLLIWKNKFNKIIESLTKTGIINARWKNEFNLYNIVSEIFKDTIYQYRCNWLGNQSLDIYIPSEKIAIEYQGEQHYNPVEYFGGVVSFEERKQLDIKKKLLCERNEVKLIEWPYTKEVSIENLYKIIQENNISLKK